MENFAYPLVGLNDGSVCEICKHPLCPKCSVCGEFYCERCLHNPSHNFIVVEDGFVETITASNKGLSGDSAESAQIADATSESPNPVKQNKLAQRRVA